MASRFIALTDEMMAPMAERFPDTFNRESTRILFALRAVAQQVNEEANAWLAPLGLNAATYNYLTNLFVAENMTLTQNEIRQFVHTTHATVAQMVRTLERAGLVRRVKNPADARSMMVTLSAKGARIMKAAAPLHHAALEERLKVLSRKDRQQLMKLLLAVSRGFDPKSTVEPSTERRRAQTMAY